MSHNFNESSIYGVDDFKHKIHQLLSDRDTKSKLKARLRIVWIKYALLKWGASPRWSFRPNFARGNIEMMTIGKMHPTLYGDMLSFLPKASSCVGWNLKPKQWNLDWISWEQIRYLHWVVQSETSVHTFRKIRNFNMFDTKWIWNETESNFFRFRRKSCYQDSFSGYFRLRILTFVRFRCMRRY